MITNNLKNGKIKRDPFIPSASIKDATKIINKTGKNSTSGPLPKPKLDFANFSKSFIVYPVFPNAFLNNSSGSTLD